MASRTITYVWKIPRPKNEGFARALMAAAYATAMQTDANVTQVLIRCVTFLLQSDSITNLLCYVLDPAFMIVR